MGEYNKRTAEELEEEIARVRERIATDLVRVEHVMRRELDWRHHVRRHPRKAIAGAFLVGLVLGLL